MKKYILCLDMDCYFVSVERLLNPNLKDKPVIVGGDNPNSRGVVSACSYEARKYGVKSGMALSKAYKLCPKAIFCKPTFDAYADYSNAIQQILKRYVPVIEQASIDEFYLDLTGCEGLYGNIFNFSWNLKKYIESTLKLPVTIGIGSNKHIAKVASNLAKQNGQLMVEDGEEKAFLANLPISFIQGVGPKLEVFFNQRGIKTIGKLANLPFTDTIKLLGKEGIHLFLKANGKGNYEFSKKADRKSIGSEITFQEDTCDTEYIKSKLFRLCEKVCYLLRKEGFLAQNINLKLRYSDFKTKSASITITATDQDQPIIKTALKLFNKLYLRRVRCRLIGISLSKLKKDMTLQLFPQEFEHKQSLYQAIDIIKDKYSSNAIKWAA